MSSTNNGKSKVQCHICGEYGDMSFKCEQVTAFIKQEIEKCKNSNVGKSDFQCTGSICKFTLIDLSIESPRSHDKVQDGASSVLWHHAIHDSIERRICKTV